MRKTFYIIIVLLSINLNAQQSSISIYGTILDSESNSPLEYATVSVYSPNDSIVKFGGISNANGKFNLEVSKGKYNIKIE